MSEKRAPQLYPSKADINGLQWLPRSLRLLIGYCTLILFVFTFICLPITAIALCFPIFWRHDNRRYTIGYIALLLLSCIVPVFEWKTFRRLGELWYELFQFSVNLSPEECLRYISEGQKEETKYIISMHPHGIIPFHAILWASFCNQMFTNKETGEELYGFGGAADVITYLPLIRNIMGFLAAGSASYRVLRKGILTNRGNKKHLFMLAGGIAEIFTAKPGKHRVVFRNRRGLVKLSLETGSQIIPTYVFGANDFYRNGLTDKGIVASLSRKLRMSIIFFGGYLWCPFLPFVPRVTMVMGPPIPVERWSKETPIPAEIIERHHDLYIRAIQELFEKYKSLAGYPDGELEIS